MLIQSLSVVNDAKTFGALMVTKTCKQMFVVETKVTKLSPRDDHKYPSSTAETRDMGTKAAVFGTPASGGAVPPGA